MAANNSVYNTHDSWTNNLTEAKHPQTSSTPAKHKPSGLQGNPQYVVIGVVVAVVIVVAVVGIGVGVYMGNEADRRYSKIYSHQTCYTQDI